MPDCEAVYSILQNFMDERDSTLEDIEWRFLHRLFGDWYCDDL
jgi:hypothetical protein